MRVKTKLIILEYKVNGVNAMQGSGSDKEVVPNTTLGDVTQEGAMRTRGGGETAQYYNGRNAHRRVSANRIRHDEG